MTAIAFGWRGLGPGPRSAVTGHPSTTEPAATAAWAGRIREWLVQAGLDEVSPMEFGGVIGGLVLVGTVVGALVFGGVLPALVTGVLLAMLPVASYRRRRTMRRRQAQESWPRLIDQIRVLTGSAGRSIPQALFEVGRRRA